MTARPSLHGSSTFAAALAFITVGIASTATAQEANPRALAIARKSAEAKRALKFIESQARAIRDPALRKSAQALLANPVPSFLDRFGDVAAIEQTRRQLVDAKLLAESIAADALFPRGTDSHGASQPFLSAPGSGSGGHHAYPGGLAEHTAFNLRSALDLAANYKAQFGIDPNRDYVIAAPLLHDAMKAYVLQWRSDGTLTPQIQIAGTPSHHVFILAEALYRKLPAPFVITLAGAHAPPSTDEGRKAVVGWLRAAAIIAGVPFQSAGLTDSGDDLAAPPPFEAGINHLSDHDWVLSEPAAAAIEAVLSRLGRAALGDKASPTRLRWMSHRIQARVSGMKLYSIWLAGGDEAVRRELEARDVPLVDAADGE